MRGLSPRSGRAPTSRWHLRLPGALLLIVALLLVGVSASSAPVSGRLRARDVDRLKARVKRLVPAALHNRRVVRHEVSGLLAADPHLTSLPLSRRSQGLRRKLTCGQANHLVHTLHRAELALFVVGEMIPEPLIQTCYLALEGLAAAALHKTETRVMELTLLEALRRPHHLRQTPLSTRTLGWLQGRLRRRQKMLAAPVHDPARYETWQMLRWIEQRLRDPTDLPSGHPTRPDEPAATSLDPGQR